MDLPLTAQWREKIGSEFDKPYMKKLLSHLKETGNYLPEKGKVFRAFQISDFDQIKVVILGQDPYHTEGYANGLAFAVANNVFPKPPSLVNIFKEVDISTFSRIDRTQSNLEGWAKQGVLLLNTILTVEPGKPMSHAGLGWEQFTDAAISALNGREEPMVFMLWGAQARTKKGSIAPKHLVLEATHPSPLSVNRGPIGERFMGCRHFSKANEWLSVNYGQKIDWTQTW